MDLRPNTPIFHYSNTPFCSRASPLDLFEQPVRGFFSNPLDRLFSDETSAGPIGPTSQLTNLCESAAA